MTECDKLFVYGTLRKNFENQYATLLQKKSKYLGNGYFFGLLYDIGYYPGAVYEPECNDKVFGDIVLFNHKEVLEILDDYEGVNALDLQSCEFRREVVTVFMEGQPVSCWTYLYNHPVHHLKRIHSGDYLQFLRNGYI